MPTDIFISNDLKCILRLKHNYAYLFSLIITKTRS